MVFVGVLVGIDALSYIQHAFTYPLDTELTLPASPTQHKCRRPSHHEDAIHATQSRYLVVVAIPLQDVDERTQHSQILQHVLVELHELEIHRHALTKILLHAQVGVVVDFLIGVQCSYMLKVVLPPYTHLNTFDFK